MVNTIIFTDTKGIPEEYMPVPASKSIPDWFKNLKSYINEEKKPLEDVATPATAKRCMPIFDAISSGYIISTHADMFVSQKEDVETGKVAPFYQWAGNSSVDFHPLRQLPEHPLNIGHEIAYPKWVNPWAIETPQGYSCLFIPPLHRETPIIALSGVVDTDTYTAPVNFPFVLRDPKMEGFIPAGTPIIQVIPFKREEWEMKMGDKESLEKQEKVSTKLRTKFFDGYKTQFRQLKEYR